MSSPEQQQVMGAQQETERLAKAAYGEALPGLKGELSSIQQALAMGESPEMKAAFGSARTSLMETSTSGDRASLSRERSQYRGAAGGGNVSASTAAPEQMGASMARALYGSRITEAGSNIEERDKLLSLAIGKGAEAGSGSLSAFGNELKTVQGMQPYNSTYANILGALNAAGTVYGAGQKSGFFNPPTAAGGSVSYGDSSTAGFGGMGF